jgi:hypothetical protein
MNSRKLLFGSGGDDASAVEEQPVVRLPKPLMAILIEAHRKMSVRTRLVINDDF